MTRGSDQAAPEEAAHDVALIGSDLGDPVTYDEPLPEASRRRYEAQIEDYEAARAEAEAGLDNLSAG